MDNNCPICIDHVFVFNRVCHFVCVYIKFIKYFSKPIIYQMTKSIKIRPYRVFKKDGRHYVKINNKKVYIATKKRRGHKSVGDKPIVQSSS